MAVCTNSSSYDPSSLVESFHDVPHVDIDLNDSPDTFDTDLEYLEAVIIWACVPILVCVCIFILMSVYFICICCCCCCGERSKPSKKSKGCCGVSIILIAIFSIVVIAVAIWAEVELNKNVQDVLDSADDVDGVLNQFGADGEYNEGRVNSSLMAIKEGILNSSGTGMQAALDATDTLGVLNENIGISFEEIDTSLPSSVLPVSDDVDSDDIDDFEEMRHWVIIAYLVLIILLLILVTVAVCCGACCSSSVCVVIMLVIFFFVTITMWVAVGGGLALLMVSSDICFDPDQVVRDFADDNVDVVNYYIVCNSACGPNPLNSTIVRANTALMLAEQEENTIQQYITNANLTDLQADLDAVVAGFDEAQQAVDSVENCTTINDDYLSIVDGLCEDAFVNEVIIFALACVMAVAFMLIMVCGSFYAGLLAVKGDYVDDDEIVPYDFGTGTTTSTSVWEAYGTQQQQTGQRTHYTQFRESYNLSPTNAPASEPPKYTDLQHEFGGGGGGTHQNGQHRHSGNYDHFDS